MLFSCPPGSFIEFLVSMSPTFLNPVGVSFFCIPCVCLASHWGICVHEGYTVKEYRYWDWNNQCIDIGGLLEDLSNAPEWAVVILHACAHNPTGMDLTKSQWLEVARVMKVWNFKSYIFLSMEL